MWEKKLPYNPADYGVKPNTIGGTSASVDELFANMQWWDFVHSALWGAYMAESFQKLVDEWEKRRKTYIDIDNYHWKDALKTQDEIRNACKNQLYSVVQNNAAIVYTQHFVAHKEQLETLLAGVKTHLLASTVKSVKGTPFSDTKWSLESANAVERLFEEFVAIFEKICTDAEDAADYSKRLYREKLNSDLRDKWFQMTHFNTTFLMIYEIIQAHNDIIVWRNTRDPMKRHCINYKIIDDADHAWIKEYIDLYHKIVMFY